MGKNEFSLPTNEDMPTETQTRKIKYPKLNVKNICSYQRVN